ncbi:MAG: DUF1573 domain-containing protein [Bacteroidota bacterium]
MKDKESIKIGLLAVIALTLIVNTYLAATRKTGTAVANNPAQQGQPQSAAVQNPGKDVVTNMNLNGNPDLSSSVIASDPVVVTNPDPNQKKTRMTFGTYAHNFGKIKQNTTNNFSFKFTNTGDEPLIITNATGSCGCTVPNYPKEPIAPGKSATIDVEYKPGLQKGIQEKKVTVTANTEPQQTILTINAEVLE